MEKGSCDVGKNRTTRKCAPIMSPVPREYQVVLQYPVNKTSETFKFKSPDRKSIKACVFLKNISNISLRVENMLKDYENLSKNLKTNKIL